MNKNYELVVDLGCGKGMSWKFFDRNLDVRRIIGVDTRQKVLDQFKEKLEVINSDIEVETFKGTGWAIPIKNNSVDLIICKSVFWAISKKSINKLLEKVSQILKPKGDLWILPGFTLPSSLMSQEMKE